MKNLKRISLKKKLNIPKMDNRGSAMITAIVAGVVMAAFAMSLILVCYTFYAQSANRTIRIQCGYLAQDMCDEITRELSNNKSDMFAQLNQQVYRVKADGSTSGVWAPKGNNKSEYFDTLEYELDTKGVDAGLNGYKIYVDFSYVLNDSDVELDGGLPDDIFDDGQDPIDDKWYEMDSASAAHTGNATVYIKVTCKKDRESYSVTESVQADFD